MYYILFCGENRLNGTERVKIIFAEVSFSPPPQKKIILLHIKSAANPSIGMFENLVPTDSPLYSFGFNPEESEFTLPFVSSELHSDITNGQGPRPHLKLGQREKSAAAIHIWNPPEHKMHRGLRYCLITV